METETPPPYTAVLQAKNLVKLAINDGNFVGNSCVLKIFSSEIFDVNILSVLTAYFWLFPLN